MLALSPLSWQAGMKWYPFSSDCPHPRPIPGALDFHPQPQASPIPLTHRYSQVQAPFCHTIPLMSFARLSHRIISSTQLRLSPASGVWHTPRLFPFLAAACFSELGVPQQPSFCPDPPIWLAWSGTVRTLAALVLMFHVTSDKPLGSLVISLSLKCQFQYVLHETSGMHWASK